MPRAIPQSADRKQKSSENVEHFDEIILQSSWNLSTQKFNLSFLFWLNLEKKFLSSSSAML
jgi:hypothetical protein